MLAMCESLPTMVLMSWLASPGTNDRTTHSRSARSASFGNVVPKVTPGIAVLISPVALRISAGAVILGSNVSNWLGPPWQKRNTTDLSVTGLPASESFVPACAVGMSHGSERPPSASEPTRRKSRRPSRAESPMCSMSELPANPERQRRGGATPSLTLRVRLNQYPADRFAAVGNVLGPVGVVGDHALGV